MRQPTHNAARRHWAASAFALCAAAAFVPHSSFAFDKTSTRAVNLDETGLALKGYDPVSYFQGSEPKLGSAQFEARNAGATYRFATEANRATFQKKPEAYLPAYGGFCAMGLAMGKKFDIDPQAWRLIDGQLYLNLNKDVQKRWLTKVQENLTLANENWPKVQTQAPDSL